jgi:hypothetical protein
VGVVAAATNPAMTASVAAPEPSSATMISSGTRVCRPTLASTAASASGRSWLVIARAMRSAGS